ncbi:MAG: gas vesicle protein K [Candidatus Electryoneaceae bacterium]|nr:gas vesicle protein K [Candidatus Electryoneaceae bacterium]
MANLDDVIIDSPAIGEFSKVMIKQGADKQHSNPAGWGGRMNLDPDGVKNGLGQLVLTLVKLLHELLEKQALRRIDGGGLTDDEIEQLGVTLMKQSAEIERLKKEFGLKDGDLNLDLGPLGKLL